MFFLKKIKKMSLKLFSGRKMRDNLLQEYNFWPNLPEIIELKKESWLPSFFN